MLTSGLERLVRNILVICLTLAVLVFGLFETAGSLIPGREISVANIRPDSGLSYIGELGDSNLSDHQTPSHVILYLVEDIPGNVLHHLNPYLSGGYLFEWLKALIDANFRSATHKVVTRLGPAHSAHESIRRKGGGQYSIWHGSVYFSVPAEKSWSYMTRIRAVDPGMPALTKLETIKRVNDVAAAIALVAASLLVIGLVGRILNRFAGGRLLLANVLPGLAISISLVAVIAAASEVYMRLAGYFPKSRNQWPSRFVPAFGFHFISGGEVRLTNGINYWTISRANSLGFLDHEPALPKPRGTYRILLVGDSFVQGAEVDLQQRLQTVFAEKLKQELPNRKIDMVALGYSGTGQSNQLGWYEEFRQPLQADIVILLIVSNDFANNSPLLESLRNGWSPDHLPWPFFRKNPDGTCERERIDPDWAQHAMPGLITARLARVREQSARHKATLEGWNPTEAEARAMDAVFFETGALPPIFEEAVELTKCSLAAWLASTKADGVPLVAVLAENIETGSPRKPDGTRPNGQYLRFARILDELGIPWLNLAPEFAKRGGNPTSSQISFDGHWNPNGHRWAAEAVLEYLKANGLLGQRPRN